MSRHCSHGLLELHQWSRKIASIKCVVRVCWSGIRFGQHKNLKRVLRAFNWMAMVAGVVHIPQHARELDLRLNNKRQTVQGLSNQGIR